MTNTKIPKSSCNKRDQMRPKSVKFNSLSTSSLYNIEQLNVTSLMPSTLDSVSTPESFKTKTSLNSIFPEEKVKFLLGVPILDTESIEKNRSTPRTALTPKTPTLILVSEKPANSEEKTVSTVKNTSFMNNSSVNQPNDLNVSRLESSSTPPNTTINQSHVIKTNITVFSCLIISVCGVIYVKFKCYNSKLLLAWILFIICKVAMHMMPPLFILRKGYVLYK